MAWTTEELTSERLLLRCLRNDDWPVLDWAWRTTDSDSLIAVTQSANARSLRLLDRLGFVFEKTFVEYEAEQTQVRMARPSVPS